MSKCKLPKQISPYGYSQLVDLMIAKFKDRVLAKETDPTNERVLTIL